MMKQNTTEYNAMMAEISDEINTAMISVTQKLHAKFGVVHALFVAFPIDQDGAPTGFTACASFGPDAKGIRNIGEVLAINADDFAQQAVKSGPDATNLN